MKYGLCRARRGIRYLRCNCNKIIYIEQPNSALWTSENYDPGICLIQCLSCDRWHRIVRYKPYGHGWRRPVMRHDSIIFNFKVTDPLV